MVCFFSFYECFFSPYLKTFVFAFWGPWEIGSCYWQEARVTGEACAFFLWGLGGSTLNGAKKRIFFSPRLREGSLPFLELNK